MFTVIISYINMYYSDVRSSTLQNKWYGESQKMVRAIFSLAVKFAPTIIFIDEVSVNVMCCDDVWIVVACHCIVRICYIMSVMSCHIMSCHARLMVSCVAVEMIMKSPILSKVLNHDML